MNNIKEVAKRIKKEYEESNNEEVIETTVVNKSYKLVYKKEYLMYLGIGFVLLHMVQVLRN